MKTAFLIYDSAGGGYARNGPIEGWHFTRLMTAAEKFATKADAEQAIRQHFQPGDNHLRIITANFDEGGAE